MPNLPKIQNTISIKEASAFLGVSSKTLRRWSEQKIISPIRTSGGHRRFVEEDLLRLKSLSSKRRITKWSLASIKAKAVKVPQAETEPISFSAGELEKDYSTKKVSDKIDLWSQLHSLLPRFGERQIKAMRISVAIGIVLIGAIVGLKFLGKDPVKVLGQKLASLLSSFDQPEELISPQDAIPSVLAESTSVDDISFAVNVESILRRDVTAETNVEVDGNLNLVGNSITSADDLTITPGGDSVIVVSDLILSDTSTLQVGGGTGTAYNAIANTADDPEDAAIGVDNDLYIGGDLEVDGIANVATLSIGGDSFTDLTGTGLQVSSGSLQTTLGTSIESSEISDDTIKEVDLNVSNSPTSGYSLTYNSSTSGFTWTNISGSGGSGPWTDGAGITYLTDTAEDFAVGGSTLASSFSVDVSANTARIGTGATANAVLNMYASDGATGSITYTTADEWNFTGGGINLDSYLDLDSTSATAFTLGDGTSNYITFDGSTDAGDTLFTINSASSGITSGTGLSVLSDTQDLGTGILLSVDALTTGTGLLIDNAANTLTTGTLIQAQSTSTAVGAIADGLLGYFNWNPGVTTTATGDLFRINIGSSGNVGNLFNVTDNGSTLFRVSEVQIESALPHAFSAAGDVSIAYDLIFTNQTASTIQAYGPLVIDAGESFESNNLTLRVYNAASVVVDGSTDVNTGTGGVLDINVNSITANNVGLNIDYTVDDGTTAANDLFGAQIDLTANDADADVFGLQIQSLASTNAAANTFECLLCLTNAENTAGTVLDAIRIGSTAATAGSIAVGIDFDTTDITDDIELQNGETINNDVDGTVLIEDGGATTLISASTTAFSINLDDTTTNTEVLCHNGLDAATGVQTVGDCNIAGGGDLAEFFGSDGSLVAGDLVEIDESIPVSEFVDPRLGQMSKAFVKKSTGESAGKTIGVVSTNPFAFVLSEGAFSQNENPVPVALAGRVPVKVSSENGEIKAGDPLISSGVPGVAMRATERGPIIGRALGDFVSWDPNQIGTVITLINLSWYDPALALNHSGELNLAQLEIIQTQPSEFRVLNAGQIVETIEVYASLVAANVKAGAIEAVSLTTDGLFAFQARIDNLLVTSGLVAPSIKTEIISPIAESNLVVNLENSPPGASSPTYGKVSVLGESGEEVASIDAQGDAQFDGQVSSESLETQDATVSGELRAGKIYADEIVTRTGSFADLFANKVSGITREEIEAMLAEAEADQELMNEASSWEVDTADGSASLNELTTENLYVTGAAAVNSLSVTESIVVGPDLVVSSALDESGLMVSSLNTLAGPLEIQSAAAQPIYLMAGLVRIDTNGNVQIAGNLDVAGSIESQKLTLIEGNPQTDIYNKLLSIVGGDGTEVASISATGSAQFKSVTTDKIVLNSQELVPVITPGGQYVYETSTNAGKATIPGGITEVTIRNPNTSTDSLIYVTPNGSTNNKVLYVKAQTGCELDPETGEPPLSCEPEFVVGFDSPTLNDVSFNWWLVSVEKQALAQ